MNKKDLPIKSKLIFLLILAFFFLYIGVNIDNRFLTMLGIVLLIINSLINLVF